MITVLATGSSGNSYAYQVGNEILLLELGIPLKKIKQGLNFNLSNVVGAFVTHEHLDHAKGVKEALSNAIDVYLTQGTKEALNIDGYRLHILDHDEDYRYSSIKIGDFTVLPFQSQHDSKEPVGYLIYHPKDGKTLFLTDSYYCKYRFNDLNRILIECNYSEDVLPQLPAWRARTIKSHMSLETLKEALRAWDLGNTKEIVLIHISQDNGDPDRFQTEINKLTGIKTYVASPGLEIAQQRK